MKTRFILGRKKRAWFQNQLSESTDDGETWKLIPTKDYISDVNDMIFKNERIGFIGAESGLYKTQDSGLHWKLMGTIKNVKALRIVDSKKWWIAGTSGIYASRDQGQTWSKVKLPKNLPHKEFYELQVSGKSVWAGGAGVILFSNDDGKSWTISWEYKNRFATPIIQGIFLNSDQKSVWAWTQNKVLKSENTGQSWTEIDMGELVPLDLIVDPSNQIVDVVGANGIYRHSENGGKTWNQQSFVDFFRLGNITEGEAGEIVNSNGWIYKNQRSLEEIKSIGRISNRLKINFMGQSEDRNIRMALSDQGEAFINNLPSLAWIQANGLPEKNLVAGHLNSNGNNIWIVDQDANIYYSSDGGKQFSFLAKVNLF